MNIGERENRENDNVTSNEEARKKMEEINRILGEEDFRCSCYSVKNYRKLERIAEQDNL